MLEVCEVSTLNPEPSRFYKSHSVVSGPRSNTPCMKTPSENLFIPSSAIVPHSRSVELNAIVVVLCFCDRSVIVLVPGLLVLWTSYARAWTSYVRDALFTATLPGIVQYNMV